MNTPSDGGPAFPVLEMTHGGGIKQRCENPGMSLRDWFAGMALQGLLARAFNNPAELMAGWAYQFADDMLTERERKNEE